jgi:hypothetical protein
MPQWEKGQSGNPAGRPVGSKNAQTDLREALEAHGKAILDQLVEKAKAGDQTTARFLLKRLLPGARSAPIQVPIQLEGTAVEQAEQVKNALAESRLTLEEAQALLAAIHSVELTREAAEISERVGKLEEMLNIKGHVQEALRPARESRKNLRDRVEAVTAAAPDPDEDPDDETGFGEFVKELVAEIKLQPAAIADAAFDHLRKMDFEGATMAVVREQPENAWDASIIAFLRRTAEVLPGVAETIGERYLVDWEPPNNTPAADASPAPKPNVADGLPAANAEGSQTQH